MLLLLETISGKVFIMILYVLLVLSLCTKDTLGVSAGCSTKGSALHCDQSKGKFLPKDSDGKTYSLFITNSDLTHLTSDDFSSYGNLNTVFITNSLFTTKSNIFKELKTLHILEITNCKVGDEVGGLFLHNTLLEELSLRGNKITSVTKNLVGHLQNLISLDLSHNEISFVEDGAFDQLAQLQEVNLEGNALQEVAQEVIAKNNDLCSICRRTDESDVKKDDETVESEMRAGPRPCSPREATRCAVDRWLDRLWWREHVLTLRLRGNPLCNTSSQTSQPMEAVVEESGGELRGVMCEEMEANKCLLHARRRLFLVEVCGMEKASAKADATQPPEEEVIAAGNMKFLYGTVTGTILGGLVIGVIVALYVRRRKTYSGVSTEEDRSLQPTGSPTVQNFGIAPANANTRPSIDEEEEHIEVLVNEGRSVYSQNVTTYSCEAAVQLHEAMRKGDSVTTRELLKNTSLSLTADENGDTLLHHAARGEEVKFIEDLVNAGSNPDAHNKIGMTPVHVALMEGNQVAALRMIKKGADLESEDVYGKKPLHIATSKGYTQIVQLLLSKKVQVDSQTKEMVTPLYMAAQEGHLGIVCLLIENGANIDVETSRGYLPIHVAAWNGHSKIVEKLIQKMKDCNVKNNYDWTPLHGASRKGHDEIVKILLHFNADPNVITKNKQTPLHKAAKGGHLQTLKELLAQGADIHLKSIAGKTALDVASEKGHAECESYLREQLTAHKPFLKYIRHTSNFNI